MFQQQIVAEVLNASGGGTDRRELVGLEGEFLESAITLRSQARRFARRAFPDREGRAIEVERRDAVLLDFLILFVLVALDRLDGYAEREQLGFVALEHPLDRGPLHVGRILG